MPNFQHFKTTQQFITKICRPYNNNNNLNRLALLETRWWIWCHQSGRVYWTQQLTRSTKIMLRFFSLGLTNWWIKTINRLVSILCKTSKNMQKILNWNLTKIYNSPNWTRSIKDITKGSNSSNRTYQRQCLLYRMTSIPRSSCNCNALKHTPISMAMNTPKIP